MASKRKLDEIGGVVDESRSFRVRLKLSGRDVQGPRRGNEQRALGDLNVIRAASAKSANRAEGLEAILKTLVPFWKPVFNFCANCTCSVFVKPTLTHEKHV